MLNLSLIVTSLLAASSVFSEIQQEVTYANAQLDTQSKIIKPFDWPLAVYSEENNWHHPVYLRSFSQDKLSTQTDPVILSFALPNKIEIWEIANRILYADADVVHISELSIEQVFQLYESLQRDYAHFIYIPESELFIASKYAFSEAQFALHEIGLWKGEVLEFCIANRERTLCRIHIPCVSTQALEQESSKKWKQVLQKDKKEVFQTPLVFLNPTISLEECWKMASSDHTVIPTLLVDMPAVLAVVKQNSFSLTLAPPAVRSLDAVVGSIKILPIKSRGNESSSGGSVEGGITGKWGDGNGIQWEGYVKGEAHDNKGNYVEGQVTQKDNGNGEVDVRAGHETQKK